MTVHVEREVNLANYERKGTPFDAEAMWTCRRCGGRPRKSTRYADEQPENVRHAPGCQVDAGEVKQ